MTTLLSPESLAAVEKEMGIPAFKIGDLVWFHPTHRMGGEARSEAVIKVTKLWVHTDHGHRFKSSEMRVRYGKYFRSVDEYDADERRRWAWAHLMMVLQRIGHICPDKVTADDIYAASLLLRLNILDERARR